MKAIWHKFNAYMKLRLMCKYHIYPGEKYYDFDTSFVSVWLEIRRVKKALKSGEGVELIFGDSQKKQEIDQ